MREGRAVAPSRRPREGCSPARPLRPWAAVATSATLPRASPVATSATLPRASPVATSATLPRASPVAEDCDPPACISGRRGLRPSRVHLRSRRSATLPYAQHFQRPFCPGRAGARPSRSSTSLHFSTAKTYHPLPTTTAHYPHSKTGNRRIKNNVPPLLISTPGCCTIRAIFEQRRGFGHGVRA